MAFTAQLGTADSRPGNVVPGLSSEWPAVGVWEWGGSATGSVVIPTDARTTQLSLAAIISDSLRRARTTQLSIAIIYVPPDIAGAEGHWEFGGIAEGEIPQPTMGVWEFSGIAVGLVDGSHVASGESDWEFGGRVDEVRITGDAHGESDWEFGGTCILDEGTPESCITADGTALVVYLDFNYAF